MSAIQSASDWRRHAEKRNRLLLSNLRIGLEIALEFIIETIKQTTLFRDVTGNLRASIGLDRLVGTTKKGNVRGGLEGQKALHTGGGTDVERLVRLAGLVFQIVIPIGMAYAPDVENRRGFVKDVFDRGLPDREIEEQFQAAVLATNQELSRSPV